MDPAQTYPGCATFGDCIYDWQTLLAAMVALGAALIAAKYTKDQVRVAERHETTRRESREAAARSTLPLALSSICQYAVQTGVELAQWRHGLQQDHFGAENPVFRSPEVPSGTIDAFERMIEASTNRIVRIRLAKIVSNVQVVATRMAGIASGEGGASVRYIEDNIELAAKLYAQSASLFEYARHETDEPSEELDPADAASALRQIEVRVPSLPDLRERVNRQLAR